MLFVSNHGDSSRFKPLFTRSSHGWRCVAGGQQADQPDDARRSDGGKGSAAIMQYQEQAATVHGRHLRRLTVFPEGSTTNGRQVLQLRTGAFRAGLPVQPVLMRYHWKNNNPAYTGSFLATGLSLMTSWAHSLEVLEVRSRRPAFVCLFGMSLRA